MKKLIRILAFTLTFFTFGMPAFASSISFDSASQITGKIIGPIASGHIEGGNQLKTYHLQITHPLSLDDPKSSCGPQEVRSLPILTEGLGRYEGERVQMIASIRCVESRFGSYAIERVHFIKKIK